MYSLKEKTIKQLTPFSVVADKKKVRKIKLDGKSTQATRSGKNIFNIFDENWKVYNGTKQTDGSIKANVQGQYFISIQNTTDYWKNYIMQNKGRTLTFSQKEIIDGYALGIVIYGTRTSTTRGYQAIDGSAGTRKISVTIADDFTSVSTVELRILRKIPPATFTDTTTVITELQLEEGNAATEYEPYGASPSPEFPSEIKSVGDDVNLFDKDNATITSLNCDGGTTFYNAKTTKSIIFDCSKYEQLAISKKIGNYFAIIASSKYPVAGVAGVIGTRLAIDDTKSKDFFSINCKDYNYLTIVFWRNTDTITESQMLDTIKIQKGTVATPYSEYGKGTVEIKQSGKNKLDLSKCTFINCTLNNDGTITSNINNSYYSEINTTELNEFIMKNKGMPITFSIKEMIENANVSVVVRGTRTNGTNYQDVNKNNDNKCTVTIADDFTEITGLSLRFNRKFTPFTDTTTTVSNLQVEGGDKATDYEPYFSKDYVLPVSAPLRSLPNGTKDTIEEDGIHRRVGSVVLDGSDDEGWTQNGLNQGYGIVIDNVGGNATSSIVSSGLCNRLKITKQDNIFKGSEKNVFATLGGDIKKIYVRIDETIDTVTKLKAYLKEHPITVQYELSEEVVEPFTDEQLEVINSIETQKGTNIFSINGELQTTLEFQYNPELTEDIKNAFKYNVVRSYIKVLATETQEEFEINEDNYLKNVDFDDCRYVENEGIIGGVVAKETTGNFVNVDTSFDIENREFEYYLGAELDDKIHYLRLGTFIVQKPENDNVKDNTSFDALDYMIKFNVEYKDRISYPCTMLDLLLDICDQAGVVCGTKTFRNSTFIIEDNQFVGGESCRDVLKAIAQIAFSWARINEYNELVLDFNLSDEITDEIDYDEYYSLEFNEKYGPVNTIILRNSQVEGENVTIKDDNLILTPIGKNKFNSKLFEEFTAELKYIQLKLKPNTQYTMSSNIPKSGDYANLFFYPNNGETPSITVNSVFEGHSHSITTQDDGIINIAYRDENNALTDEANNYWYQVEEGIATEYEAPIETGEIELVISDNPFAYTQAKREELIEAAKELFGFSYMPITMKTIGAAYLNCQDKIKIKNMQDGYFNTYIFDNKTSYNGTITNIIETKAMTKTETKYQYTGPISSAIKRTEIIVNKQEQTIKQIIETQDDIQKKMVKVETNIEGMNVSLTTAGGNNFLYFAPEYWNLYNSTDTPRLADISSSSNEYEGLKKNTISGLGYFLKQEEVEQKITLPNGTYTLSFLYKTISPGAVSKLIVDNGIRTEYVLEDVEDYTDFKIKTEIKREDGTIEIEENYLTFVVNNNEVSIGFSSNSDNSIIISDLMLNLGDMKLDWTQNSNETITDTVKIGKGIEISSTVDDVKFKADTDGIRILDADTDEVTSKFTRSGTETNNLIAHNSANLGGLMFKKVDNKVWITFIPYN